MREERPKPEFVSTGFDRALRFVAATGVVFGFASLAVWWPELPDSVPVHFDARGEPDRWGSPWVLALLPVVSAALWFGLGLCERIPHLYNYPWRITPENAQAQYANSVRMMRALRAGITWLLGLLTWSTLEIAAEGGGRLSPWFLPVFLAVIFGIVIGGLVRGARLRS